MTHITMLTQPGNTLNYFADVRVRLRLLNVADSAVMLLPEHSDWL